MRKNRENFPVITSINISDCEKHILKTGSLDNAIQEFLLV